MKYIGWISMEVDPGFAPSWLVTLNVDEAGEPLRVTGDARPVIKSFRTAGQAVDYVENYLKRSIKLEETINARVGYRILGV